MCWLQLCMLCVTVLSSAPTTNVPTQLNSTRLHNKWNHAVEVELICVCQLRPTVRWNATYYVATRTHHSCIIVACLIRSSLTNHATPSAETDTDHCMTTNQYLNSLYTRIAAFVSSHLARPLCQYRSFTFAAVGL